MKSKKPRASPSSEPPARSSSAPGFAARATRRRRVWFRLIAIAVPLANLVLLEIILRLSGYGYSSSFFLNTSANGRPSFVDNQQFARR